MIRRGLAYRNLVGDDVQRKPGLRKIDVCGKKPFSKSHAAKCRCFDSSRPAQGVPGHALGAADRCARTGSSKIARASLESFSGVLVPAAH
jgi:hypothetical protein